MTSHALPAPRSSSSSAWTTMAALALAATLAGWWFARSAESQSSASPQAAVDPTQARIDSVPLDERTRIYLAAVERGRSLAATWPKTERALIGPFWKAVAEKDFDRAGLLCPGAREEDFSPYKYFVPERVISVGTPEPHPTAKGVMVTPVLLNFRMQPHKVIKMAFQRTDDGRVVVDGRHTIWW